MRPLKRLPLDIASFPKLIEQGYKYIDKTEYIYRMCADGTYYFLSRPRRFGKSLLLSTIRALYEGKRDLFRGLWIEERWDWTQQHPVLHFSMKKLDYHERTLSQALARQLDLIAASFGLTLTDTSPKEKFESLLVALGSKQKVVVLIDEYDAPILDFLGVDEAKAKGHRDTLRNFYVTLKEHEDYVQLVLLTGVSKFSKMGVFSGLNNLIDMSMRAEYATLLGYTQQELEANFALELQQTAEVQGLPLPQMLETVRQWYNGYRFHAQAMSVYNPFSIHHFLDEKAYNNYWFSSGTPTFLINMLRQRNLYEISEVYVGTEVFDGFEVEDMDEIPLLLQTGYLTLQGMDKYGMFALDFPNQEVRQAFYRITEAYRPQRVGCSK